MKNKNKYEIVHEIARLAKEEEEIDRNPIQDKKNNYIKTINKTKKKRNYVVEAYHKVKEKEDGKK